MRRQNASYGFTLLELTMAITILSVMMLLSFFCFDATVQSWRAGQEMSDSMAQVDYVMKQIESGLRSAYFSTTVKNDDDKGLMILNDEGEDENAHDMMEWMKLGRAFIGKLKSADGQTELAELPHRIRLYVEDEGKKGEPCGLLAKAWSTDFIDTDEEEFDVDEDISPIVVSPRVIAMNCKVLKEPPSAAQTENAQEIEWEEDWTTSNALPYKVSVTLYLKPLKEGDDPIEISRDIEIPVWKYSQNPATDSQNGRNRRGQTGGQTGGQNGGGEGGAGGPSGPGQPGTGGGGGLNGGRGGNSGGGGMNGGRGGNSGGGRMPGGGMGGGRMPGGGMGGGMPGGIAPMGGGGM